MIDASALLALAKEHEADVSDAHERMWIQHMFTRERAFDRVFGATVDQVIPAPYGQLTANWPGGSVIEYPPIGARRGWTYVTNGLSQPGFDELMPRGADEPSDRGTRVLLRALVHYGYGFDTDPTRQSITTKPDFAAVWDAQTRAVNGSS